MAGPTFLVSERAHPALAEYAQQARWRSALVVADANTEEAAGRDVIDQLRGAGIRVRELVFEPRSGLRAGREQIVRVRAAIDGPAIPVAVGSGVVTDIVRYAAHSVERDFVSVATAASMDGYASGVAALELDGVKVTVPARPPLAVFADPRVVAQAPAELTRAGAGDLLAKATARVDWLAAHLLCGEPFVAAAADLMLEPLEFAISQSAQIADAQPAAVAELLRGLIQSGQAIALAGSSRPASGCEHHASHFWDLLAARGLREHGSHGLQVGYATGFAIRLQRFAYAGPLRSLRPAAPPPDPLGTAARAWLGDPGSEIAAAVDEKARFIEDAAGAWPSDDRAWERVRDALAGALALADGVPDALDVLGIPTAPGYLEINERMLRAAFRFAGRLRARYTTLDFLEGQGELAPAIEAAVAEPPAALNHSGAGRAGA
jgi:glycerol-1-phosphate dehydrogenase [NAD(P)+]